MFLFQSAKYMLSCFSHVHQLERMFSWLCLLFLRHSDQRLHLSFYQLCVQWNQKQQCWWVIFKLHIDYWWRISLLDLWRLARLYNTDGNVDSVCKQDCVSGGFWIIYIIFIHEIVCVFRIICGLSQFTTKEHISRAALEAVCFQTREVGFLNFFLHRLEYDKLCHSFCLGQSVCLGHSVC